MIRRLIDRDAWSGKMQIVIGLLCDQAGIPLSIEVFAGNTSDPKTVASQVKKIVGHFGGGSVTFVGDRGMLKIPQIEHLSEHGMHYITAGRYSGTAPVGADSLHPERLRL